MRDRSSECGAVTPGGTGRRITRRRSGPRRRYSSLAAERRACAAAAAQRPHVMPRKSVATVADVEGPWVDPDYDSGLIRRCERGWNVPVSDLSNELLATYLRQKIALRIVVPEARQRLVDGFVDGSELYPDELATR